MKKRNLYLLVAIALPIVLAYAGVRLVNHLQNRPSDPTEDSSQFVTLTDVVPDAILEIRYFSTYNFVGTRVDGYFAHSSDDKNGCGQSQGC